MKNKTKVFLFSALLCFLILFDIISKILADSFLDFHHQIVIIPNIISFEKVYNTGAAFGMFSNLTFWLALLSIIISVLIIFYLLSDKFKKKRFEIISFIFILAGAIGNIIDRILYSYVIDFISIQFINFPVFNFADICINIGVILLLAGYLFGKNNE